jgi:hypothetical protein
LSANTVLSTYPFSSFDPGYPVAKSKRITPRPSLAESSAPAKASDLPLTVLPESDADSPSLPPAGLRRVLAGVVAVHFVLIGISYLSGVAPSSLQARIVDLSRPYLAVLHLEADGVALNLATSTPKEKTHLLEQATVARPDFDSWTAFEIPGLKGGDRQRRWQRYLAGVAELGDNEQAAVAAWLVEPLAERHLDATFLRIARVPDLMTTVVDDTAAPPYTAAILRESNGPVRVVLVPAQRLASPPVLPSQAGGPNE